MNSRPQSSIVAAKRLFQLALLCLAFIFLLTPVLVQSIAQSTEERELEDKIPKHLPIRVKLKREKEKAFKDLKNEKWVRDFELEVTNISDKPIYYLSLLLLLTETKAANGRQIVFPLRYGRSELVDFRTSLQPEDIPIKPGESYVLKIPLREAKGWENFKSKEKKPEPKKVQLKFQLINFGDSTGFMRNDGVPIPNTQNNQAANSACIEREKIRETLNHPMLGQHFLPARFLPVNFSEQMLSSIPLNTEPQSGLCCPGTQCGFRTISFYSCECGEAVFTRTTGCNDPFGTCSIDIESVRTCDDGLGGTLYCPEFDLGPCSTISPLPTPYPTPDPFPTPEPSPSPDATPCPSLVCADPNAVPASSCPDFLGSHCPAGYSQEGNCCYPIPCPSPTPIQPECDGTPQFLGVPFCRWVCLPSLNSTCEQGAARNCTISRGQWNSDSCTCTYPGLPAGGGGPFCLHCTPILLDVNGDGFALTDAPGGVRFDLDGDGAPELISWTAASADDAFLVLDRNADGKIDNGAELFGNVTPQPPSNEPNGFLALSLYDRPDYGGNADRQINRDDAVFQFLRLWQDANHNGLSEPGELRGLAASGVVAISVEYKESKRADEFGNQFRYRAKVYDARHEQMNRWAWDVFFVH
jgi:hypothetical protein